uniref:Uncharacterized protein n=1 Tax=Siphoviridae sp. ctEJG5 TaxID=2827814 RepID=A0A8S5RX78_9CAUD|nr:MAG TPA: hypothetical protein [Siphoviridae sp. ctEJG5]
MELQFQFSLQIVQKNVRMEEDSKKMVSQCSH